MSVERSKLPEHPKTIEVNENGVVVKLTHWYQIGHLWYYFTIQRTDSGFCSEIGTQREIPPPTIIRGTLDEAASLYSNENLPTLFGKRKAPTRCSLVALGFVEFEVIPSE